MVHVRDSTVHASHELECLAVTFPMRADLTEAVFPCRMQRVQYRALTCLHNILSTMDVESLGGAEALQGVAQHLSSLVFSVPGEP